MADIRTFDAADKLARAVADSTLAIALAAVSARRRFTLGLSGGPTIAMILRTLAEEFYAARMPSQDTYVFFSDERWVAATEPVSNQRMARDELLDRVSIPREQVRAILTTGVTPQDAAIVAGRHIFEVFEGPPRPDLLLLTVGDDGHTAGLFPGSGALLEQETLFAATEVPDTGETRITATLPLLAAARNTHFIVTGSSKANAVRQSLFPDPEALVVPAALVKPNDGNVTWFLDSEAASLLDHPNTTSA